MTVAGDSLYTILHVDGQAVHRLNLHPNLLVGPFVFDGVTYQVIRQRVERLVISRSVTKVVEGIAHVDGAPEQYLAYGIEDGPEWVVVLDLEPAS